MTTITTSEHAPLLTTNQHGPLHQQQCYPEGTAVIDIPSSSKSLPSTCFQKIFTTSYSNALKNRFSCDSLPQRMLSSSPYSMLPSILDELNSLLDAYYEQVTAIHARTMRLYYASGLLAIITFGTSMLAFMCWYFCCFRKRNNKMMQQLEIRVKSELQQVIERENVKLQNHGLELVGHHKKEPIRKGRRMVLEDSFQVELFAFSCQNNHVSRGNSNHPASAMPYYQQ